MPKVCKTTNKFAGFNWFKGKTCGNEHSRVVKLIDGNATLHIVDDPSQFQPLSSQEHVEYPMENQIVVLDCIFQFMLLVI